MSDEKLQYKLIQVKMKSGEELTIYRPADADIKGMFGALAREQVVVFAVEDCLTQQAHLINFMEVSRMSEGVYEGRVN